MPEILDINQAGILMVLVVYRNCEYIIYMTRAHHIIAMEKPGYNGQ